MVGRTDWQITRCIAPINSTAIQLILSLNTASGSRLFRSVVRILPRRSGFESHQGRGIFFSNYASLILFTNFHIHKMGARRNGPVESLHSRGVGFMSHCTTHSFEIICRGWKVGMADHMMGSFYKNAAIRYNVSDK